MPRKALLNWTEVLSTVAKGTGKHVLYLSLSGRFQDIKLAAPYLTVEEMNVLATEPIHLLFDTMGEMMEAYNQTVGEDGPTKTNQYNGPTRIYACAVKPDGTILTENT